MRRPSVDELDRCVRGASLVSLAVLAWTVLVPNDVVWAAAAAGSVIACAAVAVVLARRPALASLAREGAGPDQSRPRGTFREWRRALPDTSTRSVGALWPRRGPPRALGEMPRLWCWLFGHERMDTSAAHGVCLRCGRRPPAHREPAHSVSGARSLESQERRPAIAPRR